QGAGCRMRTPAHRVRAGGRVFAVLARPVCGFPHQGAGRSLSFRLRAARRAPPLNAGWSRGRDRLECDFHCFGHVMITGSLVAIVTPMHEDGSLDFARLRNLIDFHVAEGTDGIVVVGTTGESPTVDVEEHCELIKVTVEHAAGRIPVIAGTGANSTAEAIELARFAASAGASAHLSVVPYYNRPTQEGLYRHFRTIAEAVELPLILYNVPGRTVADLANDTALRLAEIP